MVSGTLALPISGSWLSSFFCLRAFSTPWELAPLQTRRTQRSTGKLTLEACCQHLLSGEWGMEGKVPAFPLSQETILRHVPHSFSECPHWDWTPAAYNDSWLISTPCLGSSPLPGSLSYSLAWLPKFTSQIHHLHPSPYVKVAWHYLPNNNCTGYWEYNNK